VKFTLPVAGLAAIRLIRIALVVSVAIDMYVFATTGATNRGIWALIGMYCLSFPEPKEAEES